MDFEITRGTGVFAFFYNHPWMIVIYLLVFLFTMQWITEKESEIKDKDGKLGAVGKIVFSVLGSGIVGSIVNVLIFIIVAAFTMGSSAPIQESDPINETEIQEHIKKDPSYLDKNTKLLVEKEDHDFDKKIITSVYVRTHGQGCAHRLYIVRKTTKDIGNEDRGEYEIYKPDSLELQNILKRLNYDMSKD